MKLLSKSLISEESECSYIKEKKWQFAYFFAAELSPHELDMLLSFGWRKFGLYYFKPICKDCRECIPLRIKTKELILSKSQKRVIRDCKDIRVDFKDLEYRDEIFEIYKDHSYNRFGKSSDSEDFYNSFYTQSCPSIQSEYYVDNKLAGVGFIDISSNALSSVYFVYRNEFLNLRLGTFSIINETFFALKLGLNYYYLGYYIKNNKSMSYKNSFFINEKMSWDTELWVQEQP
jgi:arginine-tRNA-protein transferase